MKNDLKNIIALILIFVMTFMAMPISVFAEAAADGGGSQSPVFVWDGENKRSGKFYADIETGWDAACDVGHVMLMCDWNTEGALTVPENKTVSVYMNDFSIDRGLSSAKSSGEVFLVRDNAVLKIYGGNYADINAASSTACIKGGYNSNGGGGIHVQKNSRVYLYGVTVKGNKSSDGNGGGGIRLQKENGYLEMNDHAYVKENSTVSGEGGGISVYGKNCRIVGGNVQKNSSSGNGGGISVRAQGVSVFNVRLTENSANAGSKGGGIYMAKGCGCAVSGCLVKNNKVTDGSGGGIYVDGNGGSLSYSDVIGNTAAMGGGIYIDVGDSLALSGNIYVNNNNASRGDAYDNLYLATNDEKAAYISGYPTGGELHVGWDTDLRCGDTVLLSSEAMAYNTRFMISDVEGYHIYWSWSTDDGKNDRHLRASTNDYSPEQPHNSIQVDPSDRYHVIENGYKGGYDLIEGIYGYHTAENTNRDGVYYYSDGYFDAEPTVYNPSLASMSMAMSMAAYNSSYSDFDGTMHNDSYANRLRHIKLLLSDLGFADENIRINYDYTVMPTDSTIGVAMAVKEIWLNGESYLLIPIAVRGGGYEAEWASNVTIGESGEAKGFSAAADKIMMELSGFINENSGYDIKSALESGRVKFWLAGFSRGGTAANLTAKRLTDVYAKGGNEIFAYCISSPKAGLDSEVLYEKWTYDGKYLNIHNTVNAGDMVPMVGPREMGFKRYGVDHYVPGGEAGEVIESVYVTPTGLTVTTYADNTPHKVGSDGYNEKRPTLIHQLSLLNDVTVFDDYFRLSEANYTDKEFKAIEGKEHITSADWIPAFMKDLLSWAANGTYSWSTVDGDGYDGDYRSFYSTNTKFTDTNYVTVERSLQYFANLVFGMRNSNRFIEDMTYRLNQMFGDTWLMVDFYIAVIAMWDEQAQYRQRWYLDDVWEYLTKDMKYSDGTKVKSITDYVSEEEEKELKKATYSLLYFVFLFACRDYDKAPSIEGVSEKCVHIGTMINNLSTVFQCHNPEVVMSWLRSYDEHYTVTSEDRIFANSEIAIVCDGSTPAPRVEAEVDFDGISSTITLSAVIDAKEGVDANSQNNGSAIYYKLTVNGNETGDWIYYDAPIVIVVDEELSYGISAYAVRLEERGEITEITHNDIIRENNRGGVFLGSGSLTAIIGFALSFTLCALLAYLYYRKKYSGEIAVTDASDELSKQN